MMVFSLLFALGALPLAVFSSPILAPRSGPSGQVISPAGGTVISQSQNGVLNFVYKPVTESTNPGYATQYVNLYVWNQDTDVTTPLAIGLSTPDEEEDAIVSGLITADFTFNTPGAFCGNNFQLVVWEYQTGSEAPTYGFQSAAPYFSVVDCFASPPPPIGSNGLIPGTWQSPTAGATIGQHRDSAAVEYILFVGESQPYAFNLDVQWATSAINDESSWSTVIHDVEAESCWTLSPDQDHCPLYFSPMHWGLIGDVRLRVTAFNLGFGDWATQTDYIEVTVTDTY